MKTQDCLSFAKVQLMQLHSRTFYKPKVLIRTLSRFCLRVDHISPNFSLNVFDLYQGII